MPLAPATGMIEGMTYVLLGVIILWVAVRFIQFVIGPNLIPTEREFRAMNEQQRFSLAMRQMRDPKIRERRNREWNERRASMTHQELTAPKMVMVITTVDGETVALDLDRGGEVKYIDGQWQVVRRFEQDDAGLWHEAPTPA